MSKHTQYDAFISYRHCLPDSEIALRLQKKLESFRLPGGIGKRSGKPALKSVFLDETELSVADDLSVELNAALLNSEYLIAVCSPEYLKSKWCMREIQTFLDFKGREKILLVLADGEPETAFPEILLYNDVFSSDAYGNIIKSRVYKEPLAADCRGATSRERKEKTDVAVIRLISAMLGIRYDDLQQRHRKEIQARNRNRTLLGFSILGLIIAICFFFIFMIAGKNREIALQNEIITQKYADSLAATSDSLLREGNRRAAVYAARLALPDEETGNYSELAYKALVNAMGLYSLPGEFSAGDNVTLPCALESFILSPDGSYIGVLGLDGSRYVIDTQTSELKYSYVPKASSFFGFDGENGFVFREDAGNYMYCDLSSGTVTDLAADNVLFRSNPYGQGYASIDDGVVIFREGTDPVFRFDIYSEIPNLSSLLDIEVQYSSGSNHAFVVAKDFNNQVSFMYDIDLSDGTVSPIPLPDNALIGNISADTDSIIWTYYNDASRIYRRDLNTNTTISADINVSPEGYATSGNYVVAYTSEKLFLLDSSLEIVNTKTLSHFIIECAASDGCFVLSEGTSGFTVVRDGKFYFHKVEFDTNNYYSYNRSYRNGVFYAAKNGENTISTFRDQQSGYIDPYYGTPDLIYVPYMGDPEVVELQEYIANHISGLDESQIEQIVPCENADIFIVQLGNGTVYVYDKKTGSNIKTIYALDGYVRCFYYDGESESYYIGSNSIDVYDRDFRALFQIPGCILTGVDPETGYPVAVKYSGEDAYNYLIRPVTYSELISAADTYLDGYVPDDRVRERYGLE